MVTFTDRDDRRSAHLRNRAIQNANAVRERRATVENPQWAMSRDADWYQNRGNLASIKDTLVNQQGNRDFWTTDQDESRNAYQMLMNQMKGGDRGARMMDLRGLPSAVQSDPNRYRRGRTLFQDPSKSQGFFGDVRSMAGDTIPGISRKPNPAAVRAREYNPFPKAGFGKDWYKDQFPIASGLGSLMEAAENFIPGATWAKQFLPKSKRLPLERDLSWVPEGVGEYDEIPEIPFMEDITETIEEDDIKGHYDERILRGPFPPGIAYPDYNADITITDLPIEEDITETITEDDGEEFVLKEAQFDIGNLGVGTEYSPNLDLNIMNIKDSELRKKATEAALMFHQAYIEGEGGKYYGQLEDFWQAYMDAVEAGAQ